MCNGNASKNESYCQLHCFCEHFFIERIFLVHRKYSFAHWKFQPIVMLSNFSTFLKSRWSALPTKIRLSNADENISCWFRKLFKIICFHWFNFGNELNRFRMQLNYENRQVGNCWVNPITSGWGGIFSHQKYGRFEWI